MQFFDEMFVVSGTLGALGAALILLLHFSVPASRCQSRTLLFWLSVSDLLQSLFFCLFLGSRLQDPTLCVAHSVVGIVGAASSFLWTACMAFYVNYSVRHFGAQLSRGVTASLHLLCWGYPMGTAWLMLQRGDLKFEYPVAEGQLGWFSCYVPSPVWTAIHFEAPLALSWLFTLAMYAKARRALRYQLLPPSVGTDAIEELRQKFLLVPLIFLLLRVWAFVDLMVLCIYPSLRTPTWLKVVMTMRGLCDPLQGFCNAIVFVGLNPIILRKARLEFFGPREYQMHALQGPIFNPNTEAKYWTFEQDRWGTARSN